MNLIIDIGNTTAKFVLFDKDEVIEHCIADNKTLDGLSSFANTHKPAKAILSTVIPLSQEAKRRLALLPCPIINMTYLTPIPIINKYNTPESLGMDRLAAVVGAHALHPNKDVLVIDAGTCITYDFIDKTGCYHGGNISLGLKMRLAALHHYTGKLPIVSEEGQTPTLGCSTETAIRSGVINGLHYEIKGYIDKLSSQYQDLIVLMTGGDALGLDKIFDNIFPTDEWLVAKGLNHILRYNEN